MTSGMDSYYDNHLQSALRNYEHYYGMEPGTANIDLLRRSPYNIAAWLAHAGPPAEERRTEESPRISIPWAQDWKGDLRTGLRVGIPTGTQSYRDATICTDKTGCVIFEWGEESGKAPIR